MARRATVNYHVHKTERQAFEIDAGGIKGKLISPELAPTQVDVTDVREHLGALPFKENSIGFASAVNGIRSFDEQPNWQHTYDAELAQLLAVEIGAAETVVFDHTVRVDDPDASRKPARNVHSDYSPQGAEQRLVDILGKDKAADWSTGHYAFINVWRPIAAPINSAPLGFIRPTSVAAQDWILLDLIYPDRTGQIMGLAANPNHEWVYLSRMTPDEVAYFNIYDNHGMPSVGHSALDMTEDPNINTVRRSIESRTLVRFAA